MNKIIYHIITVLVTLAISLSVLYSLNVFKKEGYIDTAQVFNEFELKKFLEHKLEKQLLEYKQELDGLNLTLQNTYKDSVNGATKYIKIKELEQLIEKKTYDALNVENSLKEQYNNQIWKQLNEYITAFGEHNNIDLLYGTSGQGNIAFAKEEYNYTAACLEFVNDKYQGVE